jgi:hypothetical protein
MYLPHWTVFNGISNTMSQPLSHIFRELFNVGIVGDCSAVAWGVEEIERETVLLTSFFY